MDKIILLARAKLNLSLDITGFRDDGYHLMDMVMQSVSLSDCVTLSRRTACRRQTLPIRRRILDTVPRSCFLIRPASAAA